MNSRIIHDYVIFNILSYYLRDKSNKQSLHISDFFFLPPEGKTFMENSTLLIEEGKVFGSMRKGVMSAN